MGVYLNPKNSGFKRAIASEIYVDKTGLIEYTNKVLGTEQGYLCVSRPRRFGKSMAANMLCAYYSCGCDSESLFAGLPIVTYSRRCGAAADYLQFVREYLEKLSDSDTNLKGAARHG